MRLARRGPGGGAPAAAREGRNVTQLGAQMDPANSREALIEAHLDAAEGADMLMVPPAPPAPPRTPPQQSRWRQGRARPPPPQRRAHAVRELTRPAL